MESMKTFAAVVAVLLPLIVCILLGWRLMTNRTTDWKLATCLSGLSVATSLLLLLGSEKLAFLKYGDAVLQVNEKTEEVRKLTEQNKRIAVKTAKAIVSGLNGAITDNNHDNAKFDKDMEALLKEAGLSADEVNQILERTNSTPTTHN